MRVMVRADASDLIGTGHIYRCLTLAEGLRHAGATVEFVCRELKGHLIGRIESAPFKVHRLTHKTGGVTRGANPHSHWLETSQAADVAETQSLVKGSSQFDWLVVDHYALDFNWQSAMRPFAKRIFAFDDLADRDLDCDVLLDQNFNPVTHELYGQRLKNPKTKRLLGPQYALLRPEFLKLRERGLRPRTQVEKLFVFFGGSDPTGMTRCALGGFVQAGLAGASLDAVIGVNSPDRSLIRQEFQSQKAIRLHDQVPNIHEIIYEADLGLCAGGINTWERMCLGLPTAVAAIASNQEVIGSELAKAGYQLYLGRAENLNPESFREVIQTFHRKPELLTKMSRRACELVDGQGVARVVQEMVEMNA